MPRQSHPELNFRRGRGAIRERRRAFSRDSLEHLCDWLGMPADDKAKFLKDTDAIRDAPLPATEGVSRPGKAE